MSESKKRRVASYSSRIKANEHAARLRREGHKVRVERDRNGNFIVFIIEAVVVLSLFGALFHR